ncbi:hypothetical protein ACIBG0_28540 [Nocardia sp. NPDC050630]|uniref:hypothetical protein n=1 Tax=Nocardia sp. NPDC050630 TaxID=3364321 RepID=UPI0037BC2F2F
MRVPPAEGALNALPVQPKAHHHQRALSPIEHRSEEQARYLAEHGIERDEYGLLVSHYMTGDRLCQLAGAGAGAATWPTELRLTCCS